MSEERGLPRIGDPAPDFSAVTTQASEFNFSAWQEQHWVVLFSHPADFTPVCTTELVAFAHQYDRFRKRNVKLIGVSVDSIHAHLAWIKNIQDNLGVTIPYPLIADSDRRVSELYGMIHPQASSTATVRAVFVIDPRRTIRALVYYPLNAGRNVDEIFRLVAALQTTEKYACSTPANWQEGERVIVPPPKTVQQVEESSANADYERRDFYLMFKDASKPAAKSSPKEPETKANPPEKAVDEAETVLEKTVPGPGDSSSSEASASE